MSGEERISAPYASRALRWLGHGLPLQELLQISAEVRKKTQETLRGGSCGKGSDELLLYFILISSFFGFGLIQATQMPKSKYVCIYIYLYIYMYTHIRRSVLWRGILCPQGSLYFLLEHHPTKRKLIQKAQTPKSRCVNQLTAEMFLKNMRSRHRLSGVGKFVCATNPQQFRKRAAVQGI